jgi:FkbM family methyltransferase
MIAWLVKKLIASRYFPGRDRMLKLLLHLIGEVHTHYGIRLKVIPGDATNYYGIVGSYSEVIHNHIRSLSPDALFVDVGANQGLFSILASHQLKDGSVLALEPNPLIFPYLLQNLRINNCTNALPLNIALGEQDDVLLLSHDLRHSGTSHLMSRPSTGDGTVSRVAVINPAAFGFLAAYVKGKNLHVKIDVEGFELIVLRGLLQTQFASRIQSVVVEVDADLLRRFSSTPEQVYSLMKGAGFSATIAGHTTRHYDELFVRS